MLSSPPLYRTLQMLAAIENRMEDLFETIETLPSDRIEAAEKVTSTIIWGPRAGH